MIKEIVGYKGRLEFDSTKPDGTARKLMDVSKLKELGWQYSIPLQQGIEKVYVDFVVNNAGIITE